MKLHWWLPKFGEVEASLQGASAVVTWVCHLVVLSMAGLGRSVLT